MLVTTQPVRVASLNLVTGVGGPFTAVRARLYAQPHAASDQSTAAEFDALQPTFPGYADKLIVWAGPAMAPGKQPFKESQLLLWIATADVDPAQDIIGVYYVDSADPAILVGVDPFPAVVRVRFNLDSVQWIATVP